MSKTHANRETRDLKTIERSVEVNAPASRAYEVWTRFELFPEFMPDVEEVRVEDERHLHWRARLWGKTEEWDAEITEQIPDKRIAWRSKDGVENCGAVTFHRLSDDTCRVMLQMDYRPEGLVERLGDALGIAARRVERDLEGFKHFVETRGDSVVGRGTAIPARPDAAQEAGPAAR